MNRAALIGAVAIAAALTGAFIGTTNAGGPSVAPAVVDGYVKGMWKKVPEGWEARVQQDETQRVCSQYRNSPPNDVAQQLLTREQASVVYPADGNLLGNWKEGEKIAQNGRGGQFSDAPGTVSGGNCYACHQMARTELSYGTLGPSLQEYGKVRKFSPEDAKVAYAKVYNAQAASICSNMPRFGLNKVLTEQQIKDVVAYLFDPESPVNK